MSACIKTIVAPTLLIWGAADPIGPLKVGERLAALLPNADLRMIQEITKAADHDLALTYARKVAALIAAHHAQHS